MIQPRNSLVLFRLHEQTEKQVGKITVPTNKECFTEAEVLAVGPGVISAAGGQSETFDLRIGQRVLLKHKQRMNGPMGVSAEITGIPVREGDETLYVYEQTNVVGIIAEPV